MTLGINVNQNLRAMFNDMVSEALWPAYNATVDVFPTARFGASQRLKGTDDMGDYGSASLFPLVCWTYTGCQEISEPTIQTQRYVLKGMIRFAERGPDGIDTTPARAYALTDCDQAAQAVRNQLYQTGLTYGPFGILSTSAVTGQGSGFTWCVEVAECGDPEVTPASEAGNEDDNLAADVWIATLPVTITLRRF